MLAALEVNDSAELVRLIPLYSVLLDCDFVWEVLSQDDSVADLTKDFLQLIEVCVLHQVLTVRRSTSNHFEANC